MPHLYILDVGHGNCAVLVDDNGVVVVDAGGFSSPLAAFLMDSGLNNVSSVLLSHSDEDHIAGLRSVISQPEIQVGQVVINSDHLKSTDCWKNLAYALSDAQKRGQLRFRVGLTTGDSGTFDCGRTNIEILSPDPATAALRQRKGDPAHTDSNSSSVVVRFSTDGESKILLAADMDAETLTELLQTNPDIRTPILVWPHHGGWPGTTNTQKAKNFAQSLCAAVQPEVVILSFDRNRYKNPRPEIVEVIRECRPSAWIACTQLSKRCSDDAHREPLAHLSNATARGKGSGSCCAGSFVVDLSNLKIEPLQSRHQDFVKAVARKSLCQIGAAK